MDKKVYCHTTFFLKNISSLPSSIGVGLIPVDIRPNKSSHIFLEGIWYHILHETNDIYMFHECGYLINFYKAFNTSQLFSDYFYTEPEYNRDLKLDILLKI